MFRHWKVFYADWRICQGFKRNILLEEEQEGVQAAQVIVHPGWDIVLVEALVHVVQNVRAFQVCKPGNVLLLTQEKPEAQV